MELKEDFLLRVAKNLVKQVDTMLKLPILVMEGLKR
jgi:hypothetical protein